MDAFKRQVGLWFTICRFEAQRFRMYPFEALSSVLGYVIEAGLYISFWYLVSRYGGSSAVDLRTIMSYYLIATALSPFLFLTYSISGELSRMIKSGEITQMLLRPVSVFVYPWAQGAGRAGVGMITAAAQLTIGVVLAGSLGFGDLVMLVPALCIALAISLALNMMVGTAAFYMTEARPLRNAVVHGSRLFRGEMLPLYLMPASFVAVLQWTPFPASQYYVATILQGSHQPTWGMIAIGAFWAVSLLVVARWLWNRGLRKYEGVGL